MFSQTYKPSQAAAQLGVTVRTLQNWDRNGKLSAHRTPNNRRFYTAHQITAFLGHRYIPNVSIYKPAAASKLLGVTVGTLQQWDREGKLIAHRTPTNRRYYTSDQLNPYLKDSKGGQQ